MACRATTAAWGMFSLVLLVLLVAMCRTGADLSGEPKHELQLLARRWASHDVTQTTDGAVQTSSDVGLDDEASNPGAADILQTEAMAKKSSTTIARVLGSSDAATTTANKPPLLVATTSNQWDKTQLMLSSLWTVRDQFDLLVVDETSTDGTRLRLKNYNISVLTVAPGKGLTFNWNMAWARFMNSNFSSIIYSNNDVMIPDGVIDLLQHSMSASGGDCDLVVPLSTRRGKGSWHATESVEAVYNLSKHSSGWIQHPQNYAHVQRWILQQHAANMSACTVPLHNEELPGFSGFFFALRRSVARAAHSRRNLWPPRLRNLGQEGQLYSQLKRQDGFNMCMNICTFVYHFKGGTIPLNVDRDKWVRE